MSGIPLSITDWSEIELTEHKGESGSAFRRTQQCGDIRVRMVEYTAGYLADHWCEKGHILLCMEGELQTELKDGRKFTLTPGMSYQVSTMPNPTVPASQSERSCSSSIERRRRLVSKLATLLA